MSPQKTLSAFLLLVATFSGVTLAQEGADDFQCGAPELAKKIANADFDTIHTDYYDLKWSDYHDMLMPEKMHWHIYALPDGAEPSYSVFPDGMVEPRVSDGKLEFKQKSDFLKDLGYSKGDKIRVAINIFIPISKLRTLYIDGVDQSIDVVAGNDETLLFENDGTPQHTIDIRVSGVDTQLYVKAPFSLIALKVSGVDNTIMMEAASGTTLDMTGVNQDVRIKSEYLSDIKISGVDQSVLIEGDYKDAKVAGVDGSLRLHGPSDCGNVHDTGVGNDCRRTTDNVAVPELVCLADTKVVRSTGLSVGAWIGIAVGIVVLLCLCAIGSCALCGCCCFSVGQCCRSQRGGATVSPPPTSSFPKQPDIVEAEVVGVEHNEEDPEQQHTMVDEETTTNAKLYYS